MRSACDSPASESEITFARPASRAIRTVPAFQLVHGGRDRGHIAPDAPIADEGAVAAEAGIAGDRDPSAFRLAATELIDEVAERAPRLEVGEMCLRIDAALRNLLQEVEAKAAEHAVRRDAGGILVVAGKPGKAQFVIDLPDPFGSGFDQRQKLVGRKNRAPQASFRRRSPNVRTQLLLAPAPSPLRCRSRAHPSMTPVMPPQEVNPGHLAEEALTFG